MFLIVPSSYLGSISRSYLPDRLRQFALIRHLRAFNQDGNNGNVSLQSRLDFDPHKIGRIVKASSSPFVLQMQPFISNHDQKHPATTDCIRDILPEIPPVRDIIEIEEN